MKTLQIEIGYAVDWINDCGKVKINPTRAVGMKGCIEPTLNDIAEQNGRVVEYHTRKLIHISRFYN